MHRGTVLGDANKRRVPKNSPVMHCQRRYYQASCAIPKWLIRFEYDFEFEFNAFVAYNLTVTTGA